MANSGHLGLRAGTGTTWIAALTWVQPQGLLQLQATLDQNSHMHRGLPCPLQVGKAVGQGKQEGQSSCLFCSNYSLRFRFQNMIPQAQGCWKWVLQAGPSNQRVTKFQYAIFEDPSSVLMADSAR